MKGRFIRMAAAGAASLALAGCGPAAKMVAKVVAGSGDDAAKAAGAGGAAHAGAAADEAGGLGRQVAGEGAQQGVQAATSPGEEDKRRRR